MGISQSRHFVDKRKHAARTDLRDVNKDEDRDGKGICSGKTDDADEKERIGEWREREVRDRELQLKTRMETDEYKQKKAKLSERFFDLLLKPASEANEKALLTLLKQDGEHIFFRHLWLSFSPRGYSAVLECELKHYDRLETRLNFHFRCSLTGSDGLHYPTWYSESGQRILNSIFQNNDVDTYLFLVAKGGLATPTYNDVVQAYNARGAGAEIREAVCNLYPHLLNLFPDYYVVQTG